MYEKIKIQLFINVMRSLEEMQQGKFIVEDNIIKGDSYSIEITESSNNVELTIEGYKTGYKFYQTIPWFILNKDTDSTIRELLDRYQRLTFEKVCELNNGIKSILKNKYHPDEIHNYEPDDGDTFNTRYIISESIHINVSLSESGKIMVGLNIDNGRIDNAITMNIREFTPDTLVLTILPMYDGLIDLFTG